MVLDNLTLPLLLVVLDFLTGLVSSVTLDFLCQVVVAVVLNLLGEPDYALCGFGPSCLSFVVLYLLVEIAVRYSAS